jgi:DNA-binding MarR family transcriptional regulator
MQTSRVKDRQLTPLELAAWRGFLRLHAGLVRELDRELEAEHGLPLSHYEVLLYLDNAPDKRLRMSELASSVLLSQSGITRLVDRLERDGLVVREVCPEDRRGLNARLTQAGRHRLAEARPTHLAGIHSKFLSHLDDDDLRELAAYWERMRPGITE